MKHFSILYILFSFFTYSNCYAQTLTEIKTQIEERIATEKSLETVILKFPHQTEIEHLDNLEFLNIIYDPKPDIVKIFIKAEENEYSFYAHYEPAVILLGLSAKAAKGHIITFSDLTQIKYSKNKSLLSYIKTPEELVGKVTKRNLLPNKPLRFADIQSPTTIHKGQKVTIQFSKDNLVIETVGIALESGGLNDSIKLKNLDSGRVVIGRIKAAELVEVGGNN